MTEIQYDKAFKLKCDIKDLNKLLDNIEIQKGKTKDPDLIRVLDFASTKAFNDISNLESEFRAL